MRTAIGVTAVAWLMCLLEIFLWRDKPVPALFGPPQAAIPLPNFEGDIWLFMLVILSAVLVLEIITLAVLEVANLRVSRQVRKHKAAG